LNQDIETLKKTEAKLTSDKLVLTGQVAKLEKQVVDRTDALAQFRTICENQVKKLAECERLLSESRKDASTSIGKEMESSNQLLDEARRQILVLREENTRLEKNAKIQEDFIHQMKCVREILALFFL